MRNSETPVAAPGFVILQRISSGSFTLFDARGRHVRFTPKAAEMLHGNEPTLYIRKSTDFVAYINSLKSASLYS